MAWPGPIVDIRVDYDYAPPLNQPDVSPLPATGAHLGCRHLGCRLLGPTAEDRNSRNERRGRASAGVAAPRLKVSIINCQFSIAGFDVAL